MTSYEEDRVLSGILGDPIRGSPAEIVLLVSDPRKPAAIFNKGGNSHIIGNVPYYSKSDDVDLVYDGISDLSGYNYLAIPVRATQMPAGLRIYNLANLIYNWMMPSVQKYLTKLHTGHPDLFPKAFWMHYLNNVSVVLHDLTVSEYEHFMMAVMDETFAWICKYPSKVSKDNTIIHNCWPDGNARTNALYLVLAGWVDDLKTYVARRILGVTTKAAESKRRKSDVEKAYKLAEDYLGYNDIEYNEFYKFSGKSIDLLLNISYDILKVLNCKGPTFDNSGILSHTDRMTPNYEADGDIYAGSKYMTTNGQVNRYDDYAKSDPAMLILGDYLEADKRNIYTAHIFRDHKYRYKYNIIEMIHRHRPTRENVLPYLYGIKEGFIFSCDPHTLNVDVTGDMPRSLGLTMMTITAIMMSNIASIQYHESVTSLQETGSITSRAILTSPMKRLLYSSISYVLSGTPIWTFDSRETILDFHITPGSIADAIHYVISDWFEHFATSTNDSAYDASMLKLSELSACIYE